MDKLKPILDNKFWVLLFFAILLPTIGWFVASGTFAEEIEKREGELKNAFGSVEFSAEVPNEKWEAAAAKLVEEEQARLDTTSRSLWETQKKTMFWPPRVEPLMADVPYEGPIPPQAREYYRRLGAGYSKQLDEIEAILQPYKVDPKTGARSGLVLINRAAYTHVDPSIWGSVPPTSKAMWDAQIDAWLVSSIFKSIAAMNRADEKLSDSTIVQVLELRLRGGIRDYAASAGTASAAGGASGTPTGEGYDDNIYASGGGGYGSDAGTGGGGQFSVNVSFDLSDELGPDSTARGGTSSASGYGTADATAPSTEGGAATTSAASGSRRYVDDDENLPFRTRGFVLGVVMHHGYLNDFLAQLSGSEWPIQVIRVHQQMNNPDRLALASRTGNRSFGSGSYGTSGSYGNSGGFGGAGGGFPTGEYGGSDSDASGFGSPMPGSSGGSSAGYSSGAMGNDLMVRQALSDPHLATVYIGGLITLFKPVEEPEAADPTDAGTDTSTTEDDPAATTELDPENPNPSDAETVQPADSTNDNNPEANPTESEATPDSATPVPDPEAENTDPAVENSENPATAETSTAPTVPE